MTSVLFVCLGNICRSPAAEGVLKHMLAADPELQHVIVSSCGMGNWHEGELPDERMRETAKFRGLNLTSRAKSFKREYFKEFDYILAADEEVLHLLYQHAKSTEEKSKIHLLTVYSKSYPNKEIPDPYYQGAGAFDTVLNMIEDACEGLIHHIKTKKT